MASRIHLLIDGAEPPPLLARQLARFGVPHRLFDLRDAAERPGDEALPPLRPMLPDGGIVACMIAGDAADRLCRRFADDGLSVLRLDGGADDAIQAAALAGTLGGLLDRLDRAHAPAA